MSKDQHAMWYATPMSAGIHGGHDGESPKSVVERLREERNKLRNGTANVGEHPANGDMRKKLMQAEAKVKELTLANEKLREEVSKEKARADRMSVAAASRSANAVPSSSQPSVTVPVAKSADISVTGVRPAPPRAIPHVVKLKPRKAPQGRWLLETVRAVVLGSLVIGTLYAAIVVSGDKERARAHESFQI
jgi:hypothetical protein